MLNLLEEVLAALKISVSCDISEIPSVNCTPMFNKKKQDIGIIGSLKFDEKRPVAIASINLDPESFDEFRDTCCLTILLVQLYIFENV